MNSDKTQNDKPQNDIVVLAHGLAGTPMDMWRIARALKQQGYEVHNWRYRSFGNHIETHAQRLGEKISQLQGADPDRKIHIVTHSMGGIIARAMFADPDFCPEVNRIGRVVMLAPPHQGSHAARLMAPWLGWLTPSLLQLSDASDSYVNQLPNSLLAHGIEFGIVESTKDRVIAEGNVLLDGYRDYARVSGQHGIFGWYANTVKQVEAFITHGKFREALETSGRGGD